MLPPKPTSPAIVLEPLRAAWSVAPTTLDDDFRHVLGRLGAWLSEPSPAPDPWPPDPPPPEAGEKPLPPPEPPPTPTYPFAPLFDAMRALDTARPEAWVVVLACLP